MSRETVKKRPAKCVALAAALLVALLLPTQTLTAQQVKPAPAGGRRRFHLLCCQGLGREQ